MINKHTIVKLSPGVFVVYLIIIYTILFNSAKVNAAEKDKSVLLNSNPIETNVLGVNTDYISGKANFIYIPSLNIQLNVTDGYYLPDLKTWTITQDYIHFATISVNPNNTQGTTVLYGHNTEKLFKKLLNIEADQTVIISTNNDHLFEYKLNSKEEVPPTYTNIFSDDGVPQLILITCSGKNDSKRTLFHFDLVSSQ